MALFAVTYQYTDNPAGRDLHRPEHVAFLASQHEAGRLRVSGPTDGGTGALLVLAGDTAHDVEALLNGDPFRREGLIARRTVAAWKPFFGADRLELSGAAR
ncbi:YciI family protein [Sinomonas sp. R1AF57]|uniref:YciI family protein n=1 Tax=Sinomonas sp. R1AF57 TaxID=2020377 RepID=UPI000B61F8B6|nr:YciI family protein [Sinomonas sp. R1AF57]ASN53244.1 hypothetical protein CGQ25_15025 [Sinomonas sp. R1AF57]